jgi:DNA-binding CsgD family transcriptional regulator
LEDANTALRVILDQRNRDREELEQTIVSNAETMIVPLLERLRRQLGTAPETIYADAAIRNLRELVHPFAQSLDALAGAQLTLREREIANLIRAGKNSAEIAEALFIARSTVAFHRTNLRRKLGLAAHGPSLAIRLARLP